MRGKQNLEGKIIEVTQNSIYWYNKKGGTTEKIPVGSLLLVLKHSVTMMAQVLSFPSERSWCPPGTIEIFCHSFPAWKVLRTGANVAQDPNVLL